MIGKNQLVIDAKDWVRGISSSAEMTDGGFSPETVAVNLITPIGTIHHPASLVDSDTDVRLTREIIASSPDDDSFLGYERKMVTTDGKYYRYNGTKIPETALRTDGTNTYSSGFTDMITFAGETYITTKEKLVRWDETGATFNASFASFTSTTYPHPAITYENNAYYGDGNLLKIQSSAGGALSTVLTLSSDQIIVALGIDPNSGLMLISTSDSLNSSDTISSINRIHWYDGNSAKSSKVAIVDDLVIAFEPVGATVFVFYGNNMGYLNGSGISFLRKLNNVSLSSAELPFKHKVTHIGSTLYVVDGLSILAFGEVGRGNRVFYYAVYNTVNSNKPTALFNVGNNKLVISFASAKFYTCDTTSVSTTGTLALYSLKYNFPRPVFLRSISIEYSDAVVSNDNNRTIYYKTEDAQSGFLLLFKQNQTTSTSLKNQTGASIYFQDKIIGFTKNKVMTLQLKYVADTTNTGVKRIIVYYDVAE